jgi:hypothetical protein
VGLQSRLAESDIDRLILVRTRPRGRIEGDSVKGIRLRGAGGNRAIDVVTPGDRQATVLISKNLKGEVSILRPHNSFCRLDELRIVRRVQFAGGRNPQRIDGVKSDASPSQAV